MKPTVGRIVHYVSHGTPRRPDGSQVYPSACRAAVIAEVCAPEAHPGDAAPVGLCVLNPSGMFFDDHVIHDQGTDVGPTDSPFCGGRVYHGGSWHWPERAG